MAPSRKPGTTAALPEFIPPQLATLTDKAPAGGEIAVLGEDGVTSFAALQDALSRGQAERQSYHVFDLLLSTAAISPAYP
jgi:ATP-dependent DNA ligase